MNKHRVSAFFIVVFVTLVWVFGIFGFSQSHEVCNLGCDFTSLTEAVHKADSGDKILVKPGVYEVNLKLDKDLTIEGEGGKDVMLEGAAEGEPVVLIGPANVEVKLLNLTITDSQGESCADGETGLCPNGVSIIGQGTATIRGCRVADNNWNGIQIQQDGRVRIEESRITGNVDGIVAEDQAQLQVFDSTVTNRSVGILLRNSATADIRNNKIYGAMLYGVALSIGNCGFNEASCLFSGAISGHSNQFKNNGRASYCPPALDFLAIGEGGTYSPE